MSTEGVIIIAPIVTNVNDITARHLAHLDSLRKRHACQLNSRVGCKVGLLFFNYHNYARFNKQKINNYSSLLVSSSKCTPI